MPRTNVTDQELLAFAAGDVDPEAAAKVRAHIATNFDAAKTVELYRLARVRIAEDGSVVPPASVIERAKAIFEAPAGEVKRGLLEHLDAIVAKLVYDSRIQPSAVRYADTADHIQLSFEADEMDIDLQAERQADEASSGRWRLMGQVDSEGPLSVLEIELVRTETNEVISSSGADEHAVFTIEVDAGNYTMRIRLPESMIVVEGIELE